MEDNLKERMIRYRAKERISMREMANRCGVTLQTIYNIENGLQDPSRLTIAKIELVLDGQEEE